MKQQLHVSHVHETHCAAVGCPHGMLGQGMASHFSAFISACSPFPFPLLYTTNLYYAVVLSFFSHHLEEDVVTLFGYFVNCCWQQRITMQSIL